MRVTSSTSKVKDVQIPVDVLVTTVTVEEKRAKAQRSASEWNSLLRWARLARGPQWDFSTAIYMVDRGSAEYWQGVEAALEPDPEGTADSNSRSASVNPNGDFSQHPYGTGSHHGAHSNFSYGRAAHLQQMSPPDSPRLSHTGRPMRLAARRG